MLPILLSVAAACGPCGPGLGCSGGTCKSIVTDTVAYADHCKRELGFTNPDAKLGYLSCFDSPDGRGGRSATGRQSDIRLTLRDGDETTTFHVKDNGPPVRDGMDVWDLVGTHGCDNPNYLYGGCDAYYRLNVWKPDPVNDKIVAALHCRDGSDVKPDPPSAVTADARLRAFLDAPASTPASERLRLFEQWNGTSEIVLILANTDTGKACFFHASRPYYGSRVPAPDDERDISTPAARAAVWDELPVKPPYGPNDTSRRGEWLRNAANGWHQPDYMQCTGCHDSGPFLHNPFIDSMNRDGIPYLPVDRRNRPYLPLGYQAQTRVDYIRTDAVRGHDGGLESQRCTTCHAMGSSSACSSWFDRAVGWEFPSSASQESRRSPALARYMAPHAAATTADFYRENGPHIDAMRCCCENPTWAGCRTVPRATPLAAGVPGTDARSCVAPACGGWGQACCASSECNHSGLTCEGNRCLFKDET